MTFAEYMEQALYGPDGYYTNRVAIGGAGADFYTAAHSPLFGFTLGNYVHSTWVSWGRPYEMAIIEVGAGEGYLAEHLLQAVHGWSGEVELTYRIIEPSQVLRDRQYARLSPLAGLRHPHCTLSWSTSLTDQAANPLHTPTVLIANEVLDALPVERLRRTPHGWERACVAFNGTPLHGSHTLVDADLELYWETAPRHLSDLAEKWLPIPPGACAELSPITAIFMSDCARVTTGHLRAVYIDYGITMEELSAGARPTGTVRAYRQHRLVSNVLDASGLQDITADVHWDYVANSAVEGGLKLIGRTHQGRFLVQHGILNVLTELQQSLVSAVRSYRMAGEFKQLCLPGGMGERFEVLECETGR